MSAFPNQHSLVLGKLYFRHGPVSSAKTMNLLAVAYNYRLQGKNVLLLKPSLDIRFGQDEIRSRAGLFQKADFLISSDSNILDLPLSSHDQPIHCLLVDEVQFLEVHHIEQLRLAASIYNIPIICYGLRTDFRTNLFTGAKRLLELADCIEEIETTCHYCPNKAVLNLKHVNGVADTFGPIIQLGTEEKYYPTCFHCYRREVGNANQSPVSEWRNEIFDHRMKNPMKKCQKPPHVKLTSNASPETIPSGSTSTTSPAKSSLSN